MIGTCYKTNLASVNVFKERKLADAYEFPRSNTETVTANIVQDSINTIDWEQRMGMLLGPRVSIPEDLGSASED